MDFVEGGSYRVRDICAVPLDIIAKTRDLEKIYLEFDDGVIESSSRMMIHGRHMWELYQYLPVPVVSKAHHLNVSRRKITPDTDGEILNAILWSGVKAAKEQGIEVDINLVTYQMYCIADKVDTFTRMQLGKYVVSVSILDFIEIQEHPEIKAVQEELLAKEVVVDNDIPRAYATIDRVVKTDDSIARNGIVLSVKSSSIKMPQLYKCVGPNGFITDVDSHIFPYAVLSSFVSGLNTLVELAMESRTSAMSIYYQAGAMKDSEYLTRRLQLKCASVWRVHKGVDCGTKKYVNFPVPPKANLTTLRGIWYLDEETGEEKPIESKSLDIRGRVIKIRSSLKCQLPDRYGVCERCYGQLADSIMEGDNIGHMAATDLQKKQTQRILSNKHLVASALVDAFSFNEGERKYLITGGSKNSLIFMNPNLKGKEVLLIFQQKFATRLQDIMFIDNLATISPSSLTRLEAVKMQIVKNDSILAENVINTGTATRKAFFTAEMLEYIREHKWYIDHDGNYVVNLKDWDFGQPLMDLPMVQFSTPAHMLKTRDFMISSAKRDNKGDIIHTGYKDALAKAPTPEAGLIAFYELVSSSLTVNLTHLQIIVLSMMVSSLDDDDYRIPLDKSTGELASYTNIMFRQDTALAIAYESHFLYLFQSMESYILEHRHPHPLNKILAG